MDTEKDYCESAENCNCPPNLKNSFFEEYRRFGLTVRIERDQLVIEDRRFACRVPKELWIPLKSVAKIFAVKNLWQVINSAASGAKNLPNEKDLVRVYSIGTFGKDGETMLQVSVPKSGGLHLALLVRRGKQTQGLPGTVIKMLPVELMMFLEMLPYYLINRHRGNHVHWTSLAAIASYKAWTEEALECRDAGLLNRVLHCLKKDQLKEFMCEMIGDGAEVVTEFDTNAFRNGNFRIAAETIDSYHFNEVLCNLLFELKFTVDGWQGTDDFTESARVLPRETPTLVENIVNHTFYATYDVGQYVLEQTLLGHQVESNPQEETSKVNLPNKGEKRKATEVKTKPENKKQKLSQDLLDDMALMFEEGDDFFETSQVSEKVADIILTLPVGPSTPPPEPEEPTCSKKIPAIQQQTVSIGPESQSPYIQCAQTPPEPPQTQESSQTQSEDTVQIDYDHLKCLHIHIDDRQGSKVLTFDVRKQGVQIKFE